ncbi:glyoxalase [Longispora fulva]|uniref:Catechol 2,3-dioxygenase-like lactoylglutathione lyase family enzyme n=1 Tax=Longispora fulva TaxID=619741 RepID=A0A8J7GEA7_9ACTN|nr:VOC family protein [Longispora fulva]MBG6139038.1 catechol 2,3-dioxygenase-like lactoylglutathione lyase family enzyme [Longispora fulva]GIG58531.1 glyoxalase [Longispora fulva]
MTAQLSFVGIVVADMARTLAFYRRLGLDLPAAADSEPHVEYDLPGGFKLVWDTVDVVRSFDPDWTAPVGGHRTSLAFRFADPAEVDGAYADLVAEGYRGHKEPWDAFWGQRYAVLLDPDGNGVDLLAPLA